MLATSRVAMRPYPGTSHVLHERQPKRNMLLVAVMPAASGTVALYSSASRQSSQSPVLHQTTRVHGSLPRSLPQQSAPHMRTAHYAQGPYMECLLHTGCVVFRHAYPAHRTAAYLQPLPIT